MALSLATLVGCGDSGGTTANVHAALAAAKAADPSTPEGTMAIALADLKTGKLTAFARRVLPAKSLGGLRPQWERFCSSNMGIANTDAFNETMRSLTVHGSELLLLEKVKPGLGQATEQLKALTSMAPMFASGALGELDVKAEEGMAAIQAMAAAVGDVDVGSEKKAKKAIGIVCKAARSLRISNAHAFQRLGFEEAIAKVDILFVTLMDVMDVYDVSLRGSIHSMKARTVAVDGDTAYMELTMYLFGKATAPVPFEMTKANGRWELVVEEQVTE